MASQTMWKVYTGALAAVSTIATQKAITKGWELITGEEPPEVTDPDAPLSRALAWALASAVGIAVAQLLVGRFSAARWSKSYEGTPSLGKIKFKL